MKTIVGLCGLYAIGLISLVVECAEIPAESRIAAVGKDWYCQTICEGGCGGTARLVNNVCHCAITEHIDDGDKKLILKTADTIDLPIIFETTSTKRSTDDINPQMDETPNNNDDNDAKSVTKDDHNGKHQHQHHKVKTTLIPTKFTLKPLKPLLADLRARFGKPDSIDATLDDPIVGQMDPAIHDSEPHHNIFNVPGLFKGSPLLGQINPSIKEIEPHHNIMNGGFGGGGGGGGMGYGYHHLAPALTQSMLMSVREKLDRLLMRTVQQPYQPAVTAHETESMRNTLKQITQVNVNVRPHGTTWGYIFNNLVNQLSPIARGLVGQQAPNGTSNEDGIVEEVVSTTELVKKGKKVKSKGKAMELGKKTTVKIHPDEVTPDEGILIEESTTKREGKKLADDGDDVKRVQVEEHNDDDDNIEKTTLKTSSSTETLNKVTSVSSSAGTTPRFLPVEEGDDLVGDIHMDYDYEEGNEPHELEEPLPLPLA